MKVKIKKLHPDAKIPTRGSEHAGCWDLYATEKTKRVKDENGIGSIVYRTGIAIEPPDGYDLLILPRSSIRDTSLILANGIGYVDYDYRGEIMVSFKLDVSQSEPNAVGAQYEIGERIAQCRLIEQIPIEWVEAEYLSETKRGEGGHGSTGK